MENAICINYNGEVVEVGQEKGGKVYVNPQNWKRNYQLLRKYGYTNFSNGDSSPYRNQA